jgi:hypothetical protein
MAGIPNFMIADPRTTTPTYAIAMVKAVLKSVNGQSYQENDKL